MATLDEPELTEIGKQLRNQFRHLEDEPLPAELAELVAALQRSLDGLDAEPTPQATGLAAR